MLLWRKDLANVAAQLDQLQPPPARLAASTPATGAPPHILDALKTIGKAWPAIAAPQAFTVDEGAWLVAVSQLTRWVTEVRVPAPEPAPDVVVSAAQLFEATFGFKPNWECYAPHAPAYWAKMAEDLSGIVRRDAR